MLAYRLSFLMYLCSIRTCSLHHRYLLTSPKILLKNLFTTVFKISLIFLKIFQSILHKVCIIQVSNVYGIAKNIPHMIKENTV